MSVALPSSYDLRLYRGDDYFCGFVYGEVDTDGNSTMTTAVGWKARLQVRSSVGGEIWLDLRRDDGLSISLNADKRIEIVAHIPGETTAADGWGCQQDGVWDIEVTDPEGVRTTIFAGRFLVRPDVTREAS